MPSLRRLANCSFAALHAATGWVAYRFGCLGASRRRYERVLQLRGVAAARASRLAVLHMAELLAGP